jgi:hypothetical protein
MVIGPDDLGVPRPSETTGIDSLANSVSITDANLAEVQKGLPFLVAYLKHISKPPYR